MTFLGTPYSVLRVVALALTAMLLATTADARAGFVPVATSECEHCGNVTHPTHPNECSPVQQFCYRRDSQHVLDPGQLLTYDGEEKKCEYCPWCCAEANCPCPNLPSQIDCEIAKVSQNEAIGYDFAHPLSAASRAMVRNFLKGCVGYTGGTKMHSCAVAAFKCTTNTVWARMTFRNSVLCIIQHEWMRDGVWMDLDCPVSAQHWQSFNCQSYSSLAEAHVKVGDACCEEPKSCGNPCI